MRHYQTLLFDLDNTLMDFDGAEKAAFYAAFSVSGFSPDEEIYQLYHKINDSLWKKLERGEIRRERLFVERFELLFSRLGWAVTDVNTISEAYFTALAQQSILLPGALDVCRTLSSCYRLAIVTNGAARVQHGRFSLSGLAPYFSGLFISEEIGATKPSPDFFHAVFSALGDAEPSHYCVIGDSLTSDIAGAVAAGIDAVWITESDVAKTPHTHILKDIQALPAYFLGD